MPTRQPARIRGLLPFAAVVAGPHYGAGKGAMPPFPCARKPWVLALQFFADLALALLERLAAARQPGATGPVKGQAHGGASALPADFFACVRPLRRVGSAGSGMVNSGRDFRAESSQLFR
jgi:hypothetical protein